ncbi:MAG: exo-beta-N-acetylmuramidase NamZ domain-containing protein [Cyclobacteriaceae bacterium]|jgi:uncharacterized protein YbbC (DUF1343 family)
MIRLGLMLAALLTAGLLKSQPTVKVGAERFDLILEQTKDKRVGLLVNHTSMVGYAHLVDLLSSMKVNIKKIYAPEHGFRGTADAGEKIADGKDAKTGIPIVSLYGSNKKPTAAQLADVDVVIFDIQDVGTRFFTYISSLHYMMEACAENKKKVVVLDRPNPNGHYIDGPVLQPDQKSFVGMHPIPIVHGMTVGELARMINGEGWLAGGKKCELEVITVQFWKHDQPYSLAVRPSPNLPNDHAIALYPTTCLLEGTALSVGRGTQNPFEVIGHPSLTQLPFQFTPVSIEGMAKKPPFQDQVCFGYDFRKEKPHNNIHLEWIIQAYRDFAEKEKFFTDYFTTLAGTPKLKEQIIQGLSADEIRASWKSDLDAFKAKRAKYIIYN